MTREHPLFVLNYTDYISGISKLYESDERLLFPKLNLKEQYPELYLVIEVLEDVLAAENIEVFLYIDATSPNSIDLDTRCDEIIISSIKPFYGEEETLTCIATPIGTFDFCFIRNFSDGSKFEVPEVPLSEEIKKSLFLAPCEISFSRSDSTGEISIIHEYPADMVFPPFSPNSYLIGSPQQIHAEAYYNFRRQKEQAISEYMDKNSETLAFEMVSYVIRPD